MLSREVTFLGKRFHHSRSTKMLRIAAKAPRFKREQQLCPASRRQSSMRVSILSVSAKFSPSSTFRKRVACVESALMVKPGVLKGRLSLLSVLRVMVRVRTILCVQVESS